MDPVRRLLDVDEEFPLEGAQKAIAETPGAPGGDARGMNPHLPAAKSDRESRRRASRRTLKEVIGEKEDDRGPFDDGAIGPLDQRRELVEVDAFLVGGVKHRRDPRDLDLGEAV